MSATHKLSAEYESDKSKLVTIKNSIFDNYEKAFGRNNAGRRYTGNAVYGNSTRMVQAESDRRNIRMLEAKEASGRLEYSEDLQRSTERLESQRIIDTAKAVGLYVAPKNVANVGKQINHSKESIVYKSSLDDKAVVYKFKDPFAADNIKKHDARYAIFEHIAHNVVFPDTRYDIVGISEMYGDDVRFVLRQDFVTSYAKPTESEIAKNLYELGFENDGRYSYGNDLISITDVMGDNVIYDAEHNIRYIDPIITFKVPAVKAIQLTT